MYFSVHLLDSLSEQVSESHSVVSDSLRPHGLYSPWNSPGQNTGMGSLSLLQGISPTQGSNPGLPHFRQVLYQLSHQGSAGRGKVGVKPRSPTLQAGSLPAEPPGKPRNTRVCSLSLLRRIFPTQESNPGLLHCRRILYQLSHSLGYACGSAGKESTCNAGDLGSIPGLRRSPGEGMATHSSMLAWRIAWTAYSSWSCKELDMTE